jgi:hypothetical protein
VFYALLTLSIGLTFLPPWLATRRREGSFVLWWLYAWFLWPIAMGHAWWRDRTVPCAACAKTIRRFARRCPYCQEAIQAPVGTARRGARWQSREDYLAWKARMASAK